MIRKRRSLEGRNLGNEGETISQLNCRERIRSGEEKEEVNEMQVQVEESDW